MFEAVTIRKHGYPFRLPYPRFVGWYKCLLLDPSDVRSFKLRPFATTDIKARAKLRLGAVTCF